MSEDQEISELTGDPLPSARKAADAYARNERRVAELRRRLLKDAVAASDVSSLTDIPAHRLVALRDDQDALCFPAWQFDARAPYGVVEGLSEVLAALPVGHELARAAWFITPKPLLSGRTPMEALRDGDLDEVLTEAHAYRVS